MMNQAADFLALAILLSMVLILDGSSEIGACVCKAQILLFELSKAFAYIESSLKFPPQKIYTFLNA